MKSKRTRAVRSELSFASSGSTGLTNEDAEGGSSRPERSWAVAVRHELSSTCLTYLHDFPSPSLSEGWYQLTALQLPDVDNLQAPGTHLP